MHWFDFTEESKFALPYLNDEVHTDELLASTIVVQDSLKRLLAIDYRDAHEDEPVEKRRWKAFVELDDGLGDYSSSRWGCSTRLL